jgi:5-formyltetrahydrofolate cyclo-ligase
MTERRLGLAVAERAHACWAATRRLRELPELVAAIEAGRVVAGFVSTRAELDPAPALAEARARGARVAYPRIGEAGPRPRLRFHLTDPHELVAGRFGLLEPRPVCPEVAPADIGCLLAPGLAFDGAGHRLGFGGGYYDEWLGAVGPARPFPSLTVVGLGYDFQIVDDCPAGPDDAGVDRVVSDLRTMICTRPLSAALAGPVDPSRPEGKGS